MRAFVIAATLFLCMFPACKCKECEPITADHQVLVQFDTSLVSGFSWEELDTVYLLRFDQQVNPVDTLHFRFSGKSSPGRVRNYVMSGDFDDFHYGPRIADYYELRIKNHFRVYRFRDFDIRFMKASQSDICDCDKSRIENVTVNDTVINIARFPFIISKK
jgi:hypothetical protein